MNGKNKSEDYVILVCTAFITLNGVTDGRTDGQTDTDLDDNITCMLSRVIKLDKKQEKLYRP